MVSPNYGISASLVTHLPSTHFCEGVFHQTFWNKGRRGAHWWFAQESTEGLAEGRTEDRAEVARTMLAKGMDPQIVAECTQLSCEQVEELKKSL